MNTVAGVAVLAEAKRAVLVSVSENALRGRLVELDEFGEQAGARPYRANLKRTRATPKNAHRVGKKQPLAVKLGRWRGGPSKPR
jgi:hypothetical protein